MDAKRIILSMFLFIFILNGCKSTAQQKPDQLNIQTKKDTCIGEMSMPLLNTGKSASPLPIQDDESYISIDVTSRDKQGIFINPNVEFFLIDPLNRKTGQDPINKLDYNEIPASNYWRYTVEDPETGESGSASIILEVGQIVSGDYQIEVIGKNKGTYTIEILIYDVDQNPTSEDFENIPITPGEMHTYIFHFEKTPGYEVKIKRVNKDQNIKE